MFVSQADIVSAKRPIVMLYQPMLVRSVLMVEHALTHVTATLAFVCLDSQVRAN